MIQLAIGTAILVVLGAASVVRCATYRASVHPGVVIPVAAIGAMLALVPIALVVGGAVAELARWVWLVGSLLAVPSVGLMHEAVTARMREPTRWRHLLESEDSLTEINRIDASLESELEQLAARSPALASSPIMADRR